MKYFWFGHKDILIKAPDDKTWEVLTEYQDAEDNYEDGWVPKRKIENRMFWFDNFSERVGLSEDSSIQGIMAELLDEMLEVANTEESIFFMPPNQVVHIGNILMGMTNPPLAVIPEICLLNPDAIEVLQKGNMPSENYYVPNWDKPNNVIAPKLENNINFSQQVIPAPVLMPATALAAYETTILGHYSVDKKLVFYDAELEISQLSKQDNRKTGLGLVWVWGRGKKLWQWALPYTEISLPKDIISFTLSQKKKSFTLMLNIQESGKEIKTTPLLLKEPVISWYLTKPDDTN